jgi:hypothetical protein
MPPADFDEEAVRAKLVVAGAATRSVRDCKP